MKSESRETRAKRFAKIFWQSRADANRSQEYMALELGVHRNTIISWERGISSPKIFLVFEWFRVLGLNPMSYFLEYLYPDIYSNKTKDEDLTEALVELVRSMTPQEQKQLMFVISGRHGSSWHSLLQLLTAHCHTSMRSRFTAAQVDINNFEVESAMNSLVCPEDPMPDIEVLQHSITMGKQAALRRENGYTIK